MKTNKGTHLPVLNLRGKEYLEVKYRLVWFREEHPEWGIETTILKTTEDFTLCRAEIKDEKGRLVATAHKSESKQDFNDHQEKSETGAIGRALALCGFGTQFAPELEEGERVVDAPVLKLPTSRNVDTPKPTGDDPPAPGVSKCPKCGADGRQSQYSNGFKYFCSRYKVCKTNGKTTAWN